MYVCGQKNLLSRIIDLIDKDRLPKFCILVGNKGFGKKVVSDFIARKIGANFVPCEIKVDSVREVVENSYTITEKTLYMFSDCDDMSVGAKNALLKVTEEPPNNSYFIMTVRDISNVLGTLTSRGTVFYLDNYTVQDIQDFINHKNYIFKDNIIDIIKTICICPEDVNNASKINIKEVYDTADKFIQFIGAANLANELKIVTTLSTKKDDGKIDPVMFLRCIMLCCNSYMLGDCNNEDCAVFHKIIKNTSKYLSELNSKGSNKAMILDNWIISTHLDITGGEI